MLNTESYPVAVQRIQDKLFGVHNGTHESDILLSSRREIQHLLEKSRESFVDRVRPEVDLWNTNGDQWLVQESHSGQQRPILFDQGTLRLIYKPRSLSADNAWESLIHWYSELLGMPICQKVAYRLRGSFGWVTPLENSPCAQNDISLFYERLGMLGALAWAIGSNDFGGSNIVASSAFPTVIDAELALVPGNTLFDSEPSIEFRRSGVAPYKTINRYGEVASFSAAMIAGVACVHDPFKGSSEESCAFCQHVPFSLEKKRFYINGNEDVFCRGFSKGLNAILSSRYYLLSDSSPLLNFDTALGRVVFRPTATYVILLERNFYCLQSTGDFPDLRPILERVSTKHDVSGAISSLISEEIYSLRQGDVPRFELKMGDRRIFFGRGGANFAYSAVERARGRIKELSPSMVCTVTQAWEKFVAESLTEK